MGEVLGGPPEYSRSCGDQETVLRTHWGNGDMGDLGRRFVDCFVRALDDLTGRTAMPHWSWKGLRS